jgi:hypothetical protein
VDHVRLLALALVALLLPVASAGSEAEPEITDGIDQSDPARDIVAVWFEDAPDGVRFTIKLTALPGPRAGHLYTIAFARGGTREEVAIGFDGSRSLRSSVDTPSGWTSAGGGRARLDDALLDESYVAGAPAYLSATLPAARFGLEDGDRLNGILATTVYYDEARTEWILGADTTMTSAYVVGGKPAGIFPIVVPAWVIPMIVVGSVLAGLFAGVGLARVTRPASPAKSIVNVPLHTQPQPGERFQWTPGAAGKR